MYLYAQLADGLAEQIKKGIYVSGARLSGVRKFSEQRGVSVATAVSVYRELENRGLIEARERSGFFVRHAPKCQVNEPGISKPRSHPARVSGQNLALQLVKAANNPNMVQLAAAVPAPDFLPTRELERALTKVAREQRVRGSSYAFPPGTQELRHQIARRLAESGCTVDSDSIVITSGCQEALTLALQATTKPGDVVAIESPTFYGLLQVIEALGLKALEIPTHPREGISLPALQLAIERWPVKAVVVVPNASNPLGYTMSDEHKRELVRLLSHHRVPLIEDNVYGDLSYDARRPSACKAFDKNGTVIHCSSFSKTLAPGLRVGWIAPGKYYEKVEYLKYVTNLAAPTLSQLATARLLENGQYERHIKRVNREYAVAVNRMTEAIDRYFPERTKITRPQGGFVIWVEVDTELNSVALATRLLEQNISIAPGPLFSASQKYQNCFRLSCACTWNSRTEQALLTIGKML
ncbi:MAG: aminotransferase-like domain-containing protein [Thiotrichales bacterium]